MKGRILRGKYEIEEHLFDRDSGERHFWASDRVNFYPTLVRLTNLGDSKDFIPL